MDISKLPRMSQTTTTADDAPEPSAEAGFRIVPPLRAAPAAATAAAPPIPPARVLQRLRRELTPAAAAHGSRACPTRHRRRGLGLRDRRNRPHAGRDELREVGFTTMSGGTYDTGLTWRIRPGLPNQHAEGTPIGYWD